MIWYLLCAVGGALIALVIANNIHSSKTKALIANYENQLKQAAAKAAGKI